MQETIISFLFLAAIMAISISNLHYCDELKKATKITPRLKGIFRITNGIAGIVIILTYAFSRYTLKPHFIWMLIAWYAMAGFTYVREDILDQWMQTKEPLSDAVYATKRARRTILIFFLGHWAILTWAAIYFALGMVGVISSCLGYTGT